VSFSQRVSFQQRAGGSDLPDSRGSLHEAANAAEGTESMTVAVCLKCGAIKHGAWTRCLECGYTPDDDESYTRHLLVTDHYLSREQLEEVAARVKSGQPVDFPPELLRQAWVSKADVEKDQRACAIGCFLFLGLVAAAGAYAAWRWW
jgi:ribosomal protein L40E